MYFHQAWASGLNVPLTLQDGPQQDWNFAWIKML
jgi:hypothetical protein